MESSTKAVLGLGALSFLACSGSRNSDMDEWLSKEEVKECEKNLSGQEEVDACKRAKKQARIARTMEGNPLDATTQMRHVASKTVRDCTTLEQAHIAKALALASVVTTMGKDLFPTPTLVSPKCSDAVPYKEEFMFGFISTEEIPAVTYAFFDPRNAGCSRAATIYALGLAEQQGNFAIYDGPVSPGLPYKVKDALATFGELCEEQEMVYPTPKK